MIAALCMWLWLRSQHLALEVLGFGRSSTVSVLGVTSTADGQKCLHIEVDGQRRKVIGSGSVWHWQSTGKRCPSSLEAKIADALVEGYLHDHGHDTRVLGCCDGAPVWAFLDVSAERVRLVCVDCGELVTSLPLAARST